MLNMLVFTFILSVCFVGKVISVDSTGCGVTKGCYMDPEGCTDTSCDFLITWESAASGAATTDIGILGKLRSGEEYVSFALSNDKKMGDDDVWACLKLADSSVVLDHSKNIGQSNYQGVTTGTSGFTSSYTNGVLQCSFIRNDSLAGSEDTFYDLTANTYFMLVGNGPRLASTPARLAEHTTTPDVSTKKVDFTHNDIITGSQDPGKKIHGMFMMLAWMLCASIAVILARYYKPMWPNTKMCSKPIWFQLHRDLMFASTVLTIAGFIAIFVTLADWVSGTLSNVHAIIGTIIMAHVLINPIMAFFRPGPDSPNRVIFNWAHWTVGATGHILAVIDIAIGIDVLGMPLYSLGVFIFWIIFHIVVQITLEIMNCANRENKGLLSYKAYEKLRGPGDADDSETGAMKMSEPGSNPDEKPPPPASRGRTVVFVLYVIVTILVMLFLTITMWTF